jgi:hypothetical protein
VRDLVVRPGDRVAVSGRYVRCDDGEWLDIAWVNDLVLHGAGWRSWRSIKLIGLDATGVPWDAGPDGRTIPGRLRVTGIWQDETIRVDGQSKVRFSGHRHQEFIPPGAVPTGGWDTVAIWRDVPGLLSLRANGAIVRDRWRCTPGGAAVLIVAARDVELVERTLGPQLPRRLCVVACRYTADQVRDVEATFAARHQEWEFEAWGTQGMDQDGQPYAFADFMRVTDDLAEWADTLPDGLGPAQPEHESGLTSPASFTRMRRLRPEVVRLGPQSEPATCPSTVRSRAGRAGCSGASAPSCSRWTGRTTGAPGCSRAA